MIELSKTTYLRGATCLKSLYLNKFNSDLKNELDDAIKLLQKNGAIVNYYARLLYPDGIDTEFYKDLDIEKTITKTLELIDKKQKVIFEAAFMHNNCITVLDILLYENDQWYGIEVKSSTEVKDEYLTDISYQYYIINSSGFKLSDISIMHINNEYIRKGDLEVQKLFLKASLLEFCKQNYSQIEQNISTFKDILNGNTIPLIEVGEYCIKPYKCDFHNYCWKNIPEYSVFEISGLRMKKRSELYNAGIIKMVDVPADYKLNENQKLQIQSHRDGLERINKPAIEKFLSNLTYPLYFLDFETIHPPIPFFDNSKAYQQIPFQFSLHYLENINDEPKHYEFLSDAIGDPRNSLTKSLVNHIGEKGSILVYYMSFEKGRLTELSNYCPEYKDILKNFIERLSDLIIPFKEKYYYKPIMNGSSSIKDILPALVPEFTYDTLDIKNGDMASAAFEKLYYNKLEPDKIKTLRNNLLDYCKLDTLAMVKILKVLNMQI